MPRANRHFIPGYIWHITHRCHKKEFLLKFRKDRRRWRWWLFEAEKRYGLSVLNYAITSNHIHLLVRDNGDRNVIPRSIQLIAGRTGQEFNQRKDRRGAFWEDRYHATAIETGQHLARCLVYIDLNMVRAGVVGHPSEYEFCGYNEILEPKERYAIIDYELLMNLLGFKTMVDLSNAYRSWVDDSLRMKSHCRDRKWTESVAVGSEAFVISTHERLGFKVKGRKIVEKNGSYELREPFVSYNGILGHKSEALRLRNVYLWELNDTISR